ATSLSKMFLFFTDTLAGPTRPPGAADGPARGCPARLWRDDARQHPAAAPGCRWLEGEQLAVAQAASWLARRVDRADLELPVGDGDAPVPDLRRHDVALPT